MISLCIILCFFQFMLYWTVEDAVLAIYVEETKYFFIIKISTKILNISSGQGKAENEGDGCTWYLWLWSVWGE